MSDEKPKPFARAAPYPGPDGTGFTTPPGYGTHAVIIDTPDGDRCVWPGTEPYARNSAARINAAVEAREANLRGALKVALDALHTARVDLVMAYATEATTEMPISKAIAAVSEARGPNPIPYVPMARLVDEQLKVKQLQAAVDVLDDPSKYNHGAVVADFLEASGLRKPKPENWNDAELSRREWQVAGERVRRTSAVTRIAGGKSTAMMIQIVEQQKALRGANRPMRGYTTEFCRWEGEQAAFDQILALLRGEVPQRELIETQPPSSRAVVHALGPNDTVLCGAPGSPHVSRPPDNFPVTCRACQRRAAGQCAICGDPTDHGGVPHSRARAP